MTINITYRKRKGTALSSDELDNNFYEITQAIEKLQNLPNEPQLPQQQNHNSWQWQGDWSDNTMYSVNDVVRCDNSLFLCKKPHESSENNYQKKDFWDCILLHHNMPQKSRNILSQKTIDQLCNPSECTGEMFICLHNQELKPIISNGYEWLCLETTKLS